jgi:hypothetical protein
VIHLALASLWLCVALAALVAHQNNPDVVWAFGKGFMSIFWGALLLFAYNLTRWWLRK